MIGRMAAKRKPIGKQAGNVNLHIMLPAEMIAALDARVEEYAAGETWPKPSRTDVIRNILKEAVKSWAK